MTLTQRAAFSAVVVFVLCTPGLAAPPTLDYFFPAGAQRGKTIDVTASGKFERWPVNSWSDHQGIVIKPGKENGKLVITIADDVDPGVHWIRLHDRDGASIARPFLVGNLAETIEREPNNEPAKPHDLDTPTVTINGRLESVGDVDVFSVQMKKGETLVASVEAFETLRSPMDAVLQVLSAEGFVLEQNHDYHDLDPQIVFQAPHEDRFLVRVFAFPSVANSAIRLAGGANFVYRLTLTTAGFVDYPFPLAVERTNPGVVELVGWNIPAELRTLPVPTSTDGDEAKLFHAQLANPVFVRLEPHPTALRTHATRDKPQPLVLPVTISSRLEKPGAVDVYQFAGKKGQKLTFRIDARTLGFTLDPILEVSDAGGKVLNQSRAKVLKSDPSLDFSIPQDGAYLLSVRDLHGGGGIRYAYRLSAGVAVADFTLKVAADRFALAAKPLEIVVTVDRQPGFKDEIEMQVHGLPKSVTAPAVVFAAGAKTATLRLTATDKEAFSGPIRILGRAMQNAELVRRAQATIAELSRRTTDLWLTVMPP